MQVRAIVLAAALALAALLAGATANAETTLRWGALADPETFDPHGPDNFPAWTARRQVYEAMTLVGPTQTIEPLLAERWTVQDRLVWEFHLRDGVRFHEGEPFTSTDVVYSLNRYLKDQPYYQSVYGPPARIEAVDPLTVRITTARPEPLLYLHLSQALIASQAWAERHGLGPADWSGKTVSYADRHANGTGPFILERYEPGKETVYRRNPAYWGSDRWPIGFDRLVRRKMVDPNEGTDAILAGGLDLFDNIPARRAGEIETAKGLRLLSIPRLQVYLLGFDQKSIELRSSRIKGRNPFADPRVRQAVYQAVDVDRVIAAYGGRGRPAGYLAPKGVSGWSEELDQRLAYDPAAARHLLAEAGYPDGFDVALDCYDVQAAMCEAISAMLHEVDIDARPQPAPVAEVIDKFKARRSDFWLHAIGSNVDAADLLFWLYRSTGTENGTGFADPEVDAMLERIQAADVTYAREGMTDEVWRRVLPQTVYVPLFQRPVIWAVRQGLELPIDNQNLPDFRWARMK